MGGKAHGGKRVHRDDAGIWGGNLILGLNGLAQRAGNPEKFEIAGSYRRGKETCGDVDIVIIPSNLARFDQFCTEIFGTLKNGKPARSGLIDGVQVELYVATPENWGTQLQMWTGSMRHNITLRRRARRMGFSMSQYGFRNVDTKKLTRCATEQEVYEFLNMDYVPPVER